MQRGRLRISQKDPKSIKEVLSATRRDLDETRTAVQESLKSSRTLHEEILASKVEKMPRMVEILERILDGCLVQDRQSLHPWETKSG